MLWAAVSKVPYILKIELMSSFKVAFLNLVDVYFIFGINLNEMEY